MHARSCYQALEYPSSFLSYFGFFVVCREFYLFGSNNSPTTFNHIRYDYLNINGNCLIFFPSIFQTLCFFILNIQSLSMLLYRFWFVHHTFCYKFIKCQNDLHLTHPKVETIWRATWLHNKVNLPFKIRFIFITGERKLQLLSLFPR